LPKQSCSTPGRRGKIEQEWDRENRGGTRRTARRFEQKRDQESEEKNMVARLQEHVNESLENSPFPLCYLGLPSCKKAGQGSEGEVIFLKRRGAM
jgi:hypothetical protein